MIMMKKLLLGVAAVLIMAVTGRACNYTPRGRIINATVALVIKHYFNKKS